MRPYLANAVVTQVFPISDELSYLWIQYIDNQFQPHIGLPWHGKLTDDLQGKVVTIEETPGFIFTTQKMTDSNGNVYNTCKTNWKRGRDSKRYDAQLKRAGDIGVSRQPLELILR